MKANSFNKFPERLLKALVSVIISSKSNRTPRSVFIRLYCFVFDIVMDAVIGSHNHFRNEQSPYSVYGFCELATDRSHVCVENSAICRTYTGRQ